MEQEPTSAQDRLAEVSLLALRLGLTAFGGPAAHIAMLRDEVVTRRKWISDAHFLDLLGATNLIPGPNSTEMVIHVGQVRAGWRGMIAAGFCFVLPAALIVLACAWAYVQFGALPAAEWLLYGIKPVIIAVVAQALWGLAKTAVKGWFLASVGGAVLLLYLLGVNELTLLFGGGFLVMLVRNLVRMPPGALGALLPLGTLTPLGLAQVVPVSLGQLFWSFLKIGAVLYGSGYVLLAFLRNEFVVRLGWLTNQQLLDAIAIGQFTPGPLFTSATFIGYLVAGLPGAVLATLGIFLPSFLFVAGVNPLIPVLRRSPWMGGFLDGVNVAALGLMAAVLWELGRAALVDWLTVLLALVAALLLFRFKLNSAWLVLGGGVVALLVRWLVPGWLG
ncbi:chromate efflux transporter [Candidatus Oscillochloris fontis]|uniref:chromate efflux transporter n=1 Tax=Candidatus Oscillochloris fontis TaxID=2496868 RepID=UPI00101C4975|nr:chromate efflux transporter [Candidatus Oscillochloris fontis]